VRIDKGFSWEHPLSAHGLMHNVITNAWRGDPYPIDTLMIFMANMAWNSTMNTSEVRKMLNDKGATTAVQDPLPGGLRRLPERDDGLRRPDPARHHLPGAARLHVDAGPADQRVRRPGRFGAHPGAAAHGPVQALPGGAGRTGLAAEAAGLHHADGGRKYRDYPDFIVNYETAPGSGIGFLAGWRGKGGEKSMRGEPNPKQWEMYAQNNCVFHHHLPPAHQYMRNWNDGYMRWAQGVGLRRDRDPIVIHLYSEFLQRFRLAAQGKHQGQAAAGPAAPARADLLRPAALLVRAAGRAGHRHHAYPLNAVTQRPMAMYHSWDSQNAWLRQIHTHNYLHVNTQTALAAGIADGAWMWVESPWGKVRCHVPPQRSGGARHGVDLERHRQGRGRLEPGGRRQRVGEGLPAQPPDQRGAAGAGRRRRASPTATPSPARPPGTTCACASTRRRRRAEQTWPQFARCGGARHGRPPPSAVAGWPGWAGGKKP
jgi:hypothetical protein